VNIYDGATVNLECGRIYSGELDLSQRQNVTVQTVGDCGKATLTPSKPIVGWRRDASDSRLWIALSEFTPTQLAIGGVYVMPAHHPNVPGRWLRGTSRYSGQLRADLPSRDLSGATLRYLAAEWLIQTRIVQRYEGGVIYLAPGDDEGFPLLAQTDFYLEGKRWMIDSPGEWVYVNGELIVWPPDGQSPEGRAWATPLARGIYAERSRNLTIKNISVVDAPLGIDGNGSVGLKLHDLDVLRTGEAAIVVGRGTEVLRARIVGTLRHGIRANDDADQVRIIDSDIRGVGMLGMPQRTKGSIVFEHAVGQYLQGNRISDSAYLGIRVFRDATVTQNVIQRACLRLTDCGGIYTFARDRKPLNTLISFNQISELGVGANYGIYLDDYANAVTVRSNEVSKSPSGMQLHNAFNNLIADNIFIANSREHILFNETVNATVIRGNRVQRNRFVQADAGSPPVYRLWSYVRGSLARFAEFSNNQYETSRRRFAQVDWRGMLDFSEWQSLVAHEPGAVLTTPLGLTQFPGEMNQEQKISEQIADQ
jgi:parallel beta-helix repeat protein